MEQLLYPMAFYVFYIGALGFFNFYTRLSAFRKREVDPKYFKALQGAAPHHVVNVGRHFDNQFQAPLIFLVTLLAFLQLGKVNDFTITLAWLFVSTRLVHSFIHLGKNRVLPRFFAFFAGWIVLLILWAQLVYLVRL